MTRRALHPRPPDPRSPTGQPAAREITVITHDAALADEVSAIVASAGLSIRTVPEPAQSHPEPGMVVLLGADQSTTAAGLWRRGATDVIVVARTDPPASTWQDAVALGARHVMILPRDAERLLDHLLDSFEPSAAAPVLSVIGGRGGAGASTLATALAITAASRGTPPALIDLDPFGGGHDLILGDDPDDGLRWPDLAASRGRLQPGALRTTLPWVDGIATLSWQRDGTVPRAPSGPAVDAVLRAAVRDLALVVTDLPRTLNESVHAVLARSDLTLLVVPLEVRATAAAGQLLAVLRPLCGDLRLVTRGPSPSGLPATAVADTLDLPLAGQLRPEPDLAVALDRGLAPPTRRRGPLAELCQNLLSELAAPA